jgi:prepilin-type N-terminal cleavage/methylation domain-containing protein
MPRSAWPRVAEAVGAQAGVPCRGFTMVELVTTLLLLGILGAIALPRVGGIIGMSGSAWREQVGSALLQARTLSQGHRRLVCASVATGEVRLSMATTNPATTCNHTLNGLDNDARWAHDDQNLTITLTPSGTLYFQPDGRITSDGAGLTPVNVVIAISGESNVTLTGETGHVD